MLFCLINRAEDITFNQTVEPLMKRTDPKADRDSAGNVATVMWPSIVLENPKVE
jgi:hypothetical protein